MTKKLKLNVKQLEIKSFVTGMRENELKGGLQNFTCGLCSGQATCYALCSAPCDDETEWCF